MQNGVYPMTVAMLARYFDESGSGERQAFSFAATLAVLDGECALSYQNREGEQVTLTELTFTEGETAVRMRQRGATATEAVYAAGHTHKTLYRVAGVGELDMEIQTRRVENTLSPAGGRLLLDYEATVGGVRQRTVLMLDAKPQ